MPRPAALLTLTLAAQLCCSSPADQGAPDGRFSSFHALQVADYEMSVKEMEDLPAPRGEDYCDPATKTHVNDDPAQYYDYAIATVLKYQLHDHIARHILHQDPAAANYFGRKDVGDFLRSILRLGATRPWREVLREATGEDLSTHAMMEYFRPLMTWLRKENQGRKLGWD